MHLTEQKRCHPRFFLNSFEQSGPSHVFFKDFDAAVNSKLEDVESGDAGFESSSEFI